MEPNSERLLTKTEVKNRGWNEAMINQFLVKPDKERENPNYRSGPTMKLYEAKRVEQAEALPEFQEIQVKRRPRRENAKKGDATKRQKIEEYVNSIAVEVPELSKEELIRHACENYNAGNFRNDCWANEHAGPMFLERICVNYLRHCLTQYETHLKKIAGKVGAPDAYLEINTRVFDAISYAYPWLIEECSRQERRKQES